MSQKIIFIKIFHESSSLSDKNIFISFRANFFLILGAWLYKELMYIGHVCSQCPVQFAAVSNHIQAAQCSPLPHPKCKPNMNENRYNFMMFGALHSLPLATNRNQASSTAQCGQCLGVCMVTWSDTFFCLWCTSSVNMESRLLHSTG